MKHLYSAVLIVMQSKNISGNKPLYIALTLIEMYKFL